MGVSVEEKCITLSNILMVLPKLLLYQKHQSAVQGFECIANIDVLLFEADL